jgi:hypothetical protein
MTGAVKTVRYSPQAVIRIPKLLWFVDSLGKAVICCNRQHKSRQQQTNYHCTHFQIVSVHDILLSINARQVEAYNTMMTSSFPLISDIPYSGLPVLTNYVPENHLSVVIIYFS